MDEKTSEEREKAVAGLKEALANLETGETPLPHAGGHGIQSRTFEFEWEEEALSIRFRVPWGRVLEDEEAWQADDAEIGACIRMGLLLLEAAAEGKLLEEGEGRIEVFCTGDRAGYAVLGPDGDELDGAEDWSALAARLERAFDVPQAGDGGLDVIWP